MCTSRNVARLRSGWQRRENGALEAAPQAAAFSTARACLQATGRRAAAVLAWHSGARASSRAGWLGQHAIWCASSARTSLRTAVTGVEGWRAKSTRAVLALARGRGGGRCPTRARGRARSFEGFLCQKAAPGGVSPPKQRWAILSRAFLFHSPALPSQSHSVETSITGAYVKAADSTRAARASSVALSHCPLCAH